MKCFFFSKSLTKRYTDSTETIYLSIKQCSFSVPKRFLLLAEQESIHFPEMFLTRTLATNRAQKLHYLNGLGDEFYYLHVCSFLIVLCAHKHARQILPLYSNICKAHLTAYGSKIDTCIRRKEYASKNCFAPVIKVHGVVFYPLGVLNV